MPRIFDAVYGYIQLNPAEFRMVNTPIFQRLHRIKQLGPLHVVFPSAQHSRFSHSLGVFHIVTKMIKHLEDWNEGKVSGLKNLTERQKKLLRFAALLHDIGHVPLSHVGESVLKEHAEKELRDKYGARVDDGAVDAHGPGEAKWRKLFFNDEYMGGNTKLHERLSAEIVLFSEEIDGVLRQVWRTRKAREKAKKEIAQIIVGQNATDIPTLLLHSELDADRLDYLLRDSFFTGVGYGKIELDYMISRFVLVRDKDTTPHLCIEHKGLHTVEHYILGRFFLQTQIIYNRRVRFMDLVCSDVMRYMVENESTTWGLMDLADLARHIRHEEGDAGEHLHDIYGYTDDQVLARMRELHDELDKKGGKATDEERYINDCIKIIMDGQVPEPASTHKRLVDLGTVSGKKFEKVVGDEASQIAKDVAEKLGIDARRVKANLVAEEATKYKPRMRLDQEANREAVNITFESTEEDNEIIPAVESNASILKRLGDRALFIFNVYYIPHKPEEKPQIDEKEDTIKKAYQGFVSTHFEAEMSGCGCRSGRHMCQIVREPNGLEDVKKLSMNAKYVCENCGRVSSDEVYLCVAVGI